MTDAARSPWKRRTRGLDIKRLAGWLNDEAFSTRRYSFSNERAVSLFTGPTTEDLVSERTRPRKADRKRKAPQIVGNSEATPVEETQAWAIYQHQIKGDRR